MELLNERRAGPHRNRLRWFGLAGFLTVAVVCWEYLLNALMNPADWNLPGVAAHMGLDLALVLPVMTIALAAGLWLARRRGLARGEWAGVLGIAGLVALLFVGAMLPVVATRDAAHEWLGTRFGVSLAEMQITQVRTNLTVQEPKQLCSFASLRNPSLAGNADGAAIPLLFRIEAGASALLFQLAALLPLLVLGLFVRLRSELPPADLARAAAMLRWLARPVRLASVTGLALLGFCYGTGVGVSSAEESVVAATGTAPHNSCTAGGPVKQYRVQAIALNITMNRYADHSPGFMYALEAKVPAIQAFEAALIATRNQLDAAANVNLDVPGLTRVTPGLRKDPIQPLVIRANLGDCVRIHFTNNVNDGQPASIHILGLSHTVQNAGSSVGLNPATYAAPGQSITYEIPIPLDPAAERAYYFHDHGAGTSAKNNPGLDQFRTRQGLGLFGA
ncbi:MAG TPA: multicopper oxidase domain-containing protein, partial [Thermoanaerobaculia bacterium]|nr:multicopper oxidase domain-containing protein [Thermoanaerobaculia bacterium]